MNTCSHCFGCIGLKHQEYCILNKQYSKEEYEEILPKIVDHMRKTEEWGEFFPMTLSPFPYNDAEVQDVFPMTKEEVLGQNLRWGEDLDDVQGTTKTIAATDLPDAIDAVPDEILTWAITCEASGRPFRIIRKELEFLRNARLPLPRLHPSERMKLRKDARNPYKLFTRNCSMCGATIETTYSPERTEKVVCERCYLKETY
jgi:hypothetical protein